MKLREYKFTVLRRLQWCPGGDFAVLKLHARNDLEAARIMAGILAHTPVDDYDWCYSPIMLYYDAELECFKPKSNA